MRVHLPIPFPSEAEQLRLQAEAEKGMSATERLLAVADALVAVESISLAGSQRKRQLEYHRNQEETWKKIMKKFIEQHART